MSDLTWRAARASDAAGLAGLFQEIARTAPIGLETELADLASRLSRPGLDLDRDTLVGPTDGQEVAAFLFSLEHHDTSGNVEGSLHCLGTREPWRRRGVATTGFTDSGRGYTMLQAPVR